MPVMQVRRVGMGVAQRCVVVGVSVGFTRRMVWSMCMLVVQVVPVFVVMHKR